MAELFLTLVWRRLIRQTGLPSGLQRETGIGCRHAEHRTCFCGRMIWAEGALFVLGMGWLRIHAALTTCSAQAIFAGLPEHTLPAILRMHMQEGNICTSP